MRDLGQCLWDLFQDGAVRKFLSKDHGQRLTHSGPHCAQALVSTLATAYPDNVEGTPTLLSVIGRCLVRAACHRTAAL